MSITTASQLRILAPHQISATRRKTLAAAFIATLLASTAVLFGLRDLPVTSILLVDTLFCLFCTYAFAHRLRYLFLLHPFIVWVLGQFYETSFLLLGDGEAYIAVARLRLSFYTGMDATEYIQNLLLNLDFKELYFGFLPNILIPDYLYGTPSELAFFCWQACMNTILVSVCLLLAKLWCVLRDEYLFFIILFVVISPTFFEIGSAPTRHYVTFFSIFLFYISFTSISQSFKLHKLLWLSVSIAGVMISKIIYLVPITFFCVCYLFYLHERDIQKVTKYAIVASLGVLTIFTFPFFYGRYLGYVDIAKTGAATFGYLANVPFLSVVMKIVFALFSPFPWQKAPFFIATTYGGNSLQFVMHVFSSLTGLYFFARIIRYAKPLLRVSPDLKAPVFYGLIMSLSVMGGATGFHGYISIIFPFFAPLFAIKHHRISWLVPVGIAVGAESMYTIAMFF